MFNISDTTEIIGYSGKVGRLAHAVADKNMHRNLKYDYLGKIVQRGTVEVFLKEGWKTIRFRVENGWAKTIEVIA